MLRVRANGKKIQGIAIFPRFQRPGYQHSLKAFKITARNSDQWLRFHYIPSITVPEILQNEEIGFDMFKRVAFVRCDWGILIHVIGFYFSWSVGCRWINIQIMIDSSNRWSGSLGFEVQRSRVLERDSKPTSMISSVSSFFNLFILTLTLNMYSWTSWLLARSPLHTTYLQKQDGIKEQKGGWDYVLLASPNKKQNKKNKYL